MARHFGRVDGAEEEESFRELAGEQRDERPGAEAGEERGHGERGEREADGEQAAERAALQAGGEA